MEERDRARFRALPVSTRLAILAMFLALGMGTIAWVSFMGYTLRRTFELTPPWEVVQAFAIVSATMVASLAIIYRLFR